jgi:Flp pilus assembly protein TadG
MDMPRQISAFTAPMRRLVRILLDAASGRRGGVAIIGAITTVAIIGMAGFAVDLGAAYAQRARLQKVADSAAMAGALSWIKSSHSTTATIATISSVVSASGLSASVIQNPSGAYLASSPRNPGNPAIQVQLSAPYSLTLLRVLVSSASVTTGAYAVAEISGTGTGVMPACVLSLTNLIVNSNAGITAGACSVAANKTGSNQSILLNSNAFITTTGNIITPGGVYVNSNANVSAAGIYTGTYGVTTKSNSHVTGQEYTTGAAVTDPYSSYQSIVSNGFKNCQNYNNQTTLTPGCWQNVNINSNSSLSLKAGTYYFTGLNLNSNSSLTGTGGVTIVTQQIFSPSSNNGITITAPSATSGQPMPGVAIYAMAGININSNIVYNVNGGIYSPTSTINMDSNTYNSTACTYLVGQSITFNSNATLNETSCPASPGYPLPTGVGVGGTATIALVK